jgi:hypothetical protein
VPEWYECRIGSVNDARVRNPRRSGVGGARIERRAFNVVRLDVGSDRSDAGREPAIRDVRVIVVLTNGPLAVTGARR